MLQTCCSRGSLEHSASVTHPEMGLEGPEGAGSQGRGLQHPCYWDELCSQHIDSREKVCSPGAK